MDLNSLRSKRVFLDGVEVTPEVMEVDPVGGTVKLLEVVGYVGKHGRLIRRDAEGNPCGIVRHGRVEVLAR